MSLDLNQVRADSAGFLATHAASRHSLDAALMHVVEAAYQKGLFDALQVPAVLREPIPDMVASVADGNRSALAAAPAATDATGIPDEIGGAGQGGCTESGNVSPAPGTPAETLKGGALAKLAGMWCNDAGFQTWLHGYVPDLWDRFENVPFDGSVQHLIAGNCIRAMVGVKTRAELDHNPEAAALFKRLILQPYADHLKAKK